MACVVIALLLLACTGAEPTPSKPAPPPPLPSPQAAAPAAEKSAVPRGPSDRSAAPADCPSGTLPVPGGRFVMGQSGPEPGRDEQPVHLVRVDGFCMDRTEVTRSGEATPWVGLSFAEAAAACAERGGRLPTEAEWEKAARGGCEIGSNPAECAADNARVFPWGDAPPTCSLANHSVVGPTGPTRCSEGVVAADSFDAGAGPYGHVHLAGNAWEYVSDFYHPGVYRADRPANPGGPASGAARVLRGGGWDTFSTNMRVSNRFTDNLKGSTVGFRCVFGGATPAIEDVAPLEYVSAPIVVRMADGSPISGRWLAVTAFDAADIDSRSGLPAPGRSPVAESGAAPSGATEQVVQIRVPQSVPLRFSAALDNGTARPGMPAAASGGIAWSAGDRAIQSDGDAGVTLDLAPLKMGRPRTPRP